MFKGKIPAGATEAGLDLVEDQLDPVPIAPFPQALDKFYGGEAGAASLIGFEHNSGDSMRVQAEGTQGAEKVGEGITWGPETIRKRHLVESRRRIFDPSFQTGYTSRHLGTKRSAVKSISESDYGRFFRTNSLPIGAC